VKRETLKSWIDLCEKENSEKINGSLEFAVLIAWENWLLVFH
jgi:hypothetical protein